MDTIPCEAIINRHPSVRRSALVGVDQQEGYQIPVILVELIEATDHSRENILQEIHQIARKHRNTKLIDHFLIHPSFPVDIRHNAKIFREKLKVWAEKELNGEL